MALRQNAILDPTTSCYLVPRGEANNHGRANKDNVAEVRIPLKHHKQLGNKRLE